MPVHNNCINNVSQITLSLAAWPTFLWNVIKFYERSPFCSGVLLNRQMIQNATAPWTVTSHESILQWCHQHYKATVLLKAIHLEITFIGKYKSSDLGSDSFDCPGSVVCFIYLIFFFYFFFLFIKCINYLQLDKRCIVD